MASKPIDGNLTAEQLRAWLSYDPETGVFIRLYRHGMQSRTNTRYAGKPAGFLDRQYGYFKICVAGSRYQSHRLAWLYMTGVWPAHFIDHIDQNPANNAWSNLRQATLAENNRNRATIRKSGLKGAHWHAKDRKWDAKIKFDGKTYHFGYYDTAEEAHAAYCEACRRLHGEFASTV